MRTTLWKYLTLSDFLLQDADTGTNLDLVLVFDGTANLTANFSGAIGRLAMGHQEGRLIVQEGRFKGTIQIDASVAKITLTELESDHPRLNASGFFSYDQTRQDLQLFIDGSPIDAAAMRQVAMTIAGESKSVRNLFNIIRGGQVSGLTLQVQGKSIAELGRLNNIVIHGRLTQGKIFIPKIALNLEDVVADAVISKGILKGENLQARLGNSYGQDGKLISIPFRVQGDLKDPDVTPLHPAAVGSGVLGVLERTLKLPITIIQPVFSETKK